MKATIDVKDRKQANAIRAGLEDPAVRAIVVITGLLCGLESDGARKRVIRYVLDRLAEDGLLQRMQMPPDHPTAK